MAVTDTTPAAGERTLREHLARAIEVLVPFARFSSGFGRHARDDSWVLVNSLSGTRQITMGDVRAAEDIVAQLSIALQPVPAPSGRADARAETAREALSMIATGAFVGASNVAVAGPAAFAAKLQEIAESALTALTAAAVEKE